MALEKSSNDSGSVGGGGDTSSSSNGSMVIEKICKGRGGDEMQALLYTSRSHERWLQAYARARACVRAFVVRAAAS